MADPVTIANAVAQALPAAETAAAAATAAATQAATQAAASFSPLGAGIAFGVAAGGAGIGIGILGAAALEGSARQPEQAGPLKGTMILGIAFIEGLALIAMVFALVVVFLK
jgi:F-type H+-transporting ATPase subunit c